MVSTKGIKFIMTRWFFIKLMTAFEAFIIRIRKGISRKTSIVSRVTKRVYCYPNGVCKSICIIFLALVLTNTVAYDKGYSVVGLAVRTTGSFFTVITANTLPSATVLFFVVRLPTDTFGTISIGSACELYGTFFFSENRFPLRSCRQKMFQGGRGPLSSLQPQTLCIRRFSYADL